MLVLYKSIRLKYPERNRVRPRPAFHLGAALASTLDGPYRRLGGPPLLQQRKGRPLAAEDPYVWHCGGRYHLLFKLMQPLKKRGLRAGQLAYTSSLDLRRWEGPVLALNRTLTWRSAAGALRRQTVERLERPQVLFAAGGQPTHVFCAVAAGGHARNVVLPMVA